MWSEEAYGRILIMANSWCDVFAKGVLVKSGSYVELRGFLI